MMKKWQTLSKKIKEGRFTGAVYIFLVLRVIPSKIYIKYVFPAVIFSVGEDLLSGSYR